MISNSRNSCRLCDHYTRTNFGTHFCKQAGRLSPKCNAKMQRSRNYTPKASKEFQRVHPSKHKHTDRLQNTELKRNTKEDLSTQISRATNESCSTINTKIVPCLDSISLPFSAHPIIVAKERTNTSYHLKAHCKELST